MTATSRFTSAEFAEAHFDARANRWARALNAAPYARSLEMLPFYLLVGSRLFREPETLRLADLLCGSGILSRAFQGVFADILGIDASSEMLAEYPSAPGLRHRHVGVDEHLDVKDVLGGRDVIVSLAGLHHIYVLEGDRPEEHASVALQHATVKNWAECLSPGGVMVLADVTAPDEPALWSDDTTPLDVSARALASRYQLKAAEADFTLGGNSGVPLDPPTTVAAYTHAVLSATGCAARCNPGRWFREMVDPYGMYGHLDQFLKPDRLISSLRDAGRHVTYHEIPTPWVFNSEAEFIFYFYEKFALGPIREAGQLSPSRVNHILRAAEDLLGVHRLDSGGVAVGWRLGFYLVS